MLCPKCQCASLSVVPAEIRLYRNTSRTLSHPPITPSPDIRVCLDCGWSEFFLPSAWLSASWLSPKSPQAITNPAGSAASNVVRFGT